VLLTRSPLGHLPEGRASLDLHVLSTPPAFVLSQDQTLRECLYDSPSYLGCVGTESHSFGNCFNHWSYELGISTCSMYQRNLLTAVQRRLLTRVK
jgi:hypothetical protein